MFHQETRRAFQVIGYLPVPTTYNYSRSSQIKAIYKTAPETSTVLNIF